MSSDDRSQTAKAIGWVNQIITASLVLVLPIVAGNWLDRTFHASPFYLLLGVLLGFVAAGWHFYKIFVAISKEETN